MPSLAAIALVLRKELCEARRDRNLLLNVVITPLFLYPVIGFGMFQVMQVLEGVSERTDTVIAVGDNVPEAVIDSLSILDRHVVVPIPAPLGERPITIDAFRTWREQAAEAPDAQLPDVLLQWHSRLGSDSATLVLDGARDRSVAAGDIVRDVLDDWERRRAIDELEGVGLGEPDLHVWKLEDENTASAAQRGKELLSMVLPLVLLLMLTMGTFASALDTVVGERERGTLETLLVSPVSKGEVLIGKYLFVVISSLVAFVLNLASMSLFLGFVLRLIDVGEEVQLGIDPGAFALVFLAAVLLAAFLAAVVMTLAIPACSYREGQAVLNPFYLLTMVPGLVVVSSSEPFGMSQALIPVLNATALFKSALRGEFPREPFLVTYLVLAVCVAAALMFAAHLASREDVLLEPRMSLRQLLTGKRGGRS